MKLSVMVAVAMLSVGPVAVGAHGQSSAAPQAKPTDQELSNLIAKRISDDTALSTDAIHVSVTGGVVTLTGMVGKDADKATAERLARVPGVSRVVNNLKSREKATDAVQDTAGAVADTSKKGARKAGAAVSKTGEVITDGWISTRIRTNFGTEDLLSGSDIKVNSKDQVVTLSGTVATDAARTRAVAVAKEVEGVKRVVDRLTVAPKNPKG